MGGGKAGTSVSVGDGEGDGGPVGLGNGVLVRVGMTMGVGITRPASNRGRMIRLAMPRAYSRLVAKATTARALYRICQR